MSGNQWYCVLCKSVSGIIFYVSQSMVLYFMSVSDIVLYKSVSGIVFYVRESVVLCFM